MKITMYFSNLYISPYFMIYDCFARFQECDSLKAKTKKWKNLDLLWFFVEFSAATIQILYLLFCRLTLKTLNRTRSLTWKMCELAQTHMSCVHISEVKGWSSKCCPGLSDCNMIGALSGSVSALCTTNKAAACTFPLVLVMQSLKREQLSRLPGNTLQSVWINGMPHMV